ncbi:protein TPRXL [Ruania rhizosphaerae]|uniref:protein TPRXL n=1 Tax=Ruania rhizosphaerae TaxID=1840413 RepID=UPI00135AB8E9|nr:protein TPRXL [Ruania rhizosphaerae]
MTATSLRDELGVRKDPEFEMTLPPGWSRRAPDDETLEAMMVRMKQRLMDAHRPDLYGQLRTQLQQSFEDMRKNGVFAMFVPDGDENETLFLPVSLNASIRRAEAGQTLDQVVSTLVRDYGATPLYADKRTIRCEQQQQVRLGGDTIVSHSVLYLTPVPGAKRQRALQLVAGYGRPVDVPEDEPGFRALRSLFDACAASVRWKAPVA